MGSVMALVGFAGAANASATVDLIWIDNADVIGGCTKVARRDCTRLGTTNNSVAVSDNITLLVLLTAGPSGVLGAGVSVNYIEVPNFSVTNFRRFNTKPFLPSFLGTISNQPPYIDNVNAASSPATGAGLGLPAGGTAYLGTVTFHKDVLAGGAFEIRVGVNGPGGTDDVLDGAGSPISDTTTFNSAFLVTCGDGTTDPGEDCDDGNRDPGDCCSHTCQYEAEGSPCEDGNVCSEGDVCDSGICSSGSPAPAATVCRASAGVCDIAETCTGSSDTCPDDAFEPGTTACRMGSGDMCDPDELCTGSGPSCPTDTVTSAGTVCDAGSGDLCDSDELCTGISQEPCPADSFEPDTTVCRASAGVCDLPELCTGVVGAACPGDAFAAEGSPCEDDDVCTEGDVCDSGICSSGPPAPDGDGDGVCDGVDNCPFVPNKFQENADRLSAGDACQCGDVNNDFTVDGLDAQIARENLVGHTPLSGDFHPERCNVIGTSDCGVDDVFVLDRVAQNLPVSLQNVCEAYSGP